MQRMTFRHRAHIRSYLCFFYLNQLIFAVLDVSNFYGSFFFTLNVVSNNNVNWTSVGLYCLLLVSTRLFCHDIVTQAPLLCSCTYVAVILTF